MERPFEIPEDLNMADWFLRARLREGHGDRVAILAGDRRLTYADVDRLAARFGHVLRRLGVHPEERVIVALPDIPEFAGAFFGTLAIGSVVVMVNCHLKTDEIAYFYEYSRAPVAVVHAEHLDAFVEASKGARHLRHILVVGAENPAPHASFEALAAGVPDTIDLFPSHRDDAAIWIFSGGTTGRPKAAVQTHASFVNTTELFAKRVLGYGPDDRTLSVPKLYFGYATGCNLLFPFSVGGSSILFPERCTAEALFQQIQKHRPTILINVPTMVNHMVSHPDAAAQDLSCLRVATSAGEALPVELYDRWKKAFGVELCDGLGTAEMWHIFMTNRPGEVRPGTLGKVVPGFEVKVADDDGRALPDGEVGWLWVRGNSRAIGYWHEMEKTKRAFRGEWYVSGDMLRRDADGYFTYCGRGDDMLKVGGKWLAPAEVENCLLRHPAVAECAVVGVADENGLTKPHAYVLPRDKRPGLEEELKTFVREKLEPYKAPREVFLVDALPRTHLGKIDRGKLRRA
ncbi:benzoate-CoA ligase family protein [Polyangium jinanense]|uniref:Benzoate-CoA ligase family protein n=1 Tax=Polyangium jinanense TaxID=2829994 RepID=A0A9X3X5U7_9BACT|nr:benzoate-CoA ligase family protein [Polyangium jinanense]MDC3957341.1 benzoate-CoA ligase family protein [Polyangium jinanense]MDC3982743.1 benzoate-CoA ligase family protein [Polyangium jinanense]